MFGAWFEHQSQMGIEVRKFDCVVQRQDLGQDRQPGAAALCRGVSQDAAPMQLSLGGAFR
jgi:hypothetical protein